MTTTQFPIFALMRDCISLACCKRPEKGCRNNKGSSLRTFSTLARRAEPFIFRFPFSLWRHASSLSVIVERAFYVSRFECFLLTWLSSNPARDQKNLLCSCCKATTFTSLTRPLVNIFDDRNACLPMKRPQPPLVFPHARYGRSAWATSMDCC